MSSAASVASLSSALSAAPLDCGINLQATCSSTVVTAVRTYVRLYYIVPSYASLHGRPAAIKQLLSSTTQNDLLELRLSQSTTSTNIRTHPLQSVQQSAVFHQQYIPGTCTPVYNTAVLILIVLTAVRTVSNSTRYCPLRRSPASIPALHVDALRVRRHEGMSNIYSSRRTTTITGGHS